MAGVGALEGALLDERVQQHGGAGFTSVLASAVLAVTMAVLLWQPARAGAVVAALAALLAVQLSRLALSRRYQRGVQNDGSQARRWLLIFRVAGFVHGLAWAFFSAVLLSGADADSVEIVADGQVALAAGALVIVGFDIVAALAFAIPALLPLAIELAGQPLPGHAGLVPLTLALCAIAIFGAARANRQMLQTVGARLAAFERAQEAQRHADAADAARQAADEQHRLLTLLLQTTPEGFWFIDPQGVTLDVNPAMCRLLGRPREALIGHRAFEFFEGDALATLVSQLERRRSGEAGTYEIEIRRPDGSVSHCVNAASPIRGADGRALGSFGIWTDISVRRQAEQALHTYERVANSISDMVSVIGEDQTYRMVNDAWCRTTGIARAQAVGRRADEVLSGAFSEPRRTAYAECLALREPRSSVSGVDLPALAGRFIETTYYPYDDPAGARSVVIVDRDVTERETTRRELAESTEYLKRTLNATGDAIFASDADDPAHPVRFANEQMLRVWGIPAAKAATLTPADIMAHATPQFRDPEREVRRIAEIVAGNLADESELLLRDGRVIARRCIPARLGERTIRVWSFRDVTAESRALQLARDREAEQRALLDAIPGFIARFDAAQRYTYANARLAALCDMPAEQFVGRAIGDVVGADRVAPLAPLVARALGGEAVTLEFRFEPAGDAPAIDVRITVVPGRHPATGAPAAYAFGVDISEQKRAEASLRANETELRALLDAFPGFIATVDDALEYRYINERLAARLGAKPQDIVGHHVGDFLPPERVALVVAEVAQARAGGTPVNERHYPAFGQRPALDIEATHIAGPARPDGSQIYYMFGTDVTARKRAEEALVAARDEAERANRAKSQFLSQMSHELRTPLNAILGLGQLLASDPRHPLPASQQSYVDEMLRGARHLLELIGDVLDLGRVEAGQLGLDPAPVAMRALLEECLSLVRPLARTHEVQLPDSAAHAAACRVLADRRRLKQVLINLLANAIKYNRRPGSVRIECRPDADHVVVGVRDTGRGLTPQDQARLFQPFERLTAARSGIEGSGIGLALSRRLVEVMGGTMGVESEPGVGSLFWVRLPRSADAVSEEVAAPAALATPAAVDGAPLVLCIEDNPVNVFVMEAMFERLPGYRLVCALTPAEGLQIARAERPVLILLDVQLPEMNGPEVLARLRAREETRSIPVVAVSANAMADDIAEMTAAGAVAYLTKPIELDELQAAVQRYARTAP